VIRDGSNVNSLSRLLPSLVLATLALPVNAVLAAPSQAEALFVAGRAALKAGDAARACAQFAHSFDLEPAPATLLNLSVCEEQLGHLVSARTKLQAFLALVTAGDERVVLAGERLHAVEQKLAWLRVHVAGAPPDARVLIDGHALSAEELATPQPVDPGQHQLELLTPAGEPLQRAVEVTSGERLDVELAARARVEASVATERPAQAVPAIEQPLDTNARNAALSDGALGRAPNDTRSPLRVAAWVTLGTGAAGLAMSALFGGLSLRDKAIIGRHCQGKVCDEAGEAAARSGARNVAVANTALVVGLAGAVASGVLFWRFSATTLRASANRSAASLSYALAF
jgi:hypothetical protein